MNPRIKTLANQMKALRARGEGFVLMLGAGASLSSGVPVTVKVVADLLDKYGSHLTGSDPAERFDKLWSSAQPDDREMYLEPYLNREPAKGYQRLAELTRAGYFSRILTFNFDRLVETAFQRAGMQPGDDFLTIVRGDHTNEAVVQMMDRQKPSVKLLKLHGSLTGGNNFLFSDVEMLNYPEPIRDLVKSLTASHIIVCGYAFEDTCVERAFAEQGGPIYCVNPGGRPKRLRAFVTLRNSQDFTIDGDSGYFDTFMAELQEALQEEPAPPEAPHTNPFRYLGSLRSDDGDSLLGRDDELQELLRNANSEKPVFVMGPAKAGKTSLIRAGLIAKLDLAQQLPLYVRCRGDVLRSLEQLRKPLAVPANRDQVPSVLSWISEWAAKQNKRAVLVLDQFERVNQYAESPQGFDQLIANLRALLECRNPNLTVICVTAEQQALTRAILRLKNLWEGPVNVFDFEPKQVREAVQTYVARAGIKFEDAVFDKLEEEYTKGRDPGQANFSLAHVQSLCAVLCEKSKVDLDCYEKVSNRERPVLDIVINTCDIVNLIEDVPSHYGELLRKIIHDVAHPECNRKIVDCVKQVNEMSEAAKRTVAAGAGG
jgi:hypothetical protein